MLTAFSTRTTRYTPQEDGIILAEPREGTEQTLADAEEEYRVLSATGRRYRLLLDLGGVRSVTREAREYYGGPKFAQLYSAMAAVVASPLSRTLGNFFIMLNKPLVPTRMFETREQARAWLHQQEPER